MTAARARRAGVALLTSVWAIGAFAATADAAAHKVVVVNMTDPSAAPPHPLQVDDRTDVSLSIVKGLLQQCTVETKVEAIKPEANPIGTIIGVAAKYAALEQKTQPSPAEACDITAVDPPAGDTEAAQIEGGLRRVRSRLTQIREELTSDEHNGESSLDKVAEAIAKLTRCVGVVNDGGTDQDVCADVDTFNAARSRLVNTVQLLIERHPLPGSDGLAAALGEIKKVLTTRVPKTMDSDWYWNALRRVDCLASQADNLNDRRKVLAAAREQVRTFAVAAVAFQPSVEPYRVVVPVRRLESSVATSTISCVNYFTRQPTVPVSATREIKIDPMTVVVTYQTAPRLAASAGFLISWLGKLQYGTQSAKTGVDAATGTDTVASKIVATDITTAQTVPFSFFHARLFGQRPAYAYATAGIGLNANNGTKEVEYFIGFSLGIKNVLISGGVHYGRQQELSGGFLDGDVVGDKVSAPVSWRYVGKPAVSVSYRLPLP